MNARRIYLLDPQQLSPETIAVAFAKTSRSPEPFDVIAAELNETKSADFHEKWVVGYGHASVAEHAVLHLAVENISRLAIECLESNRLASYTEKSSRYQKWTPDSFYLPAEIEEAGLTETYNETVAFLFESYLNSLPLVQEVVKQEQPQQPGESTSAWERRLRSEYIDVCRYYLPAASLANVGMTINARALAHALRKMLSHPLAEVREVGQTMKDVATAEVPTLLKYVSPVPYLMQLNDDLTAHPALAETTADADWCKLVDYHRDGQDRVLASALYRYNQLPYQQALHAVETMDQQHRADLAEAVLGRLGQHDEPMRELEYCQMTFDVFIDQGAYFELKRHRMMTQTPQALTTRLGYALPSKIIKAGLEENYRQAMQKAADTFELLAERVPAAAGYIVPNAFNRRVLLQMNMRSALHLVELRAADNAHFAIRRLARRIETEIRRVYPLLAKYFRLGASETTESITNTHFIA